MMVSDKGFFEMIFSKDYNLLAVEGGVLFTKGDFEKLKECMVEVGHKYFFVIENSIKKPDSPSFRMKYPVSITWEEIIDSNYIASALLEMYHNEYFVFGESDVWGKYSANDRIHPVDIIGFKPEFSNVFHERFKASEKERLNILESLPADYRERLG